MASNSSHMNRARLRKHEVYVRLIAFLGRSKVLGAIKHRIEKAIIANYADHLFDREFYKSQLSNEHQGSDPLEHYLKTGVKLGFKPHRLFEVDYYKELSPEMPEGINPLVHHYLIGQRRGRSPCRWFDRQYYLDRNNDVRIAKIDPYTHFLRYGVYENRSSSTRFDPQYYLNNNDDARQSGQPALFHFIDVGRVERRPARSFLTDTSIISKQHMFREAEEGADTLDRDTLLKNLSKLKRSAKPSSALVDVVIPVYRNFNITLRCIFSVLTASNQTSFNVVVVDDQSPDLELKKVLTELAAHGLIELIEHETNLGFVKSVNAGMKQNSGRDVILLNSDTEVYGNWIDRLRDVANSDEKISTVTPLTNNGTICSYPYFNQENGVPVEIDTLDIDVLARDLNEGAWIPAPTCVGFCTYIKRKVIEAVGLFDAETFGLGYGEENDFSLRAQQQGWIDAIAPNVFVYHVGSASFLSDKSDRVARASKLIQKRYPKYHSAVAGYIDWDPVRPFRLAIDRGRLRRLKSKRNILLISHARGGGTEKKVLDNIRQHEEEGVSVFRLIVSDQTENAARLVHCSAMALPNLPDFDLRSSTGRAVLIEWLKDLEIEEFEIHHLADLWPQSPDIFSQLAHEAGIAYRFIAHDYLSICPRINLVDDKYRYCGEPSPEHCNRCLKIRGNEFEATDIAEWRSLHHAFLADAESISVPDEDVRARLLRYFPDLTISVDPHDHVAQAPACLRQRGHSDKIRIGVPGAISPIKGLDVLKRCARYAGQNGIGIEFVVVGYTSDDPSARRAGLEVTGPYSSDSLVDELCKAQLDAVFLPSTWPETFSYTLSGALQAGLPIIAFDLGAIANRLRGTENSMTLPVNLFENPGEIVARIAQFVDDKSSSLET